MRNNVVTITLIGLNILVFAVMAIQQGNVLFDTNADFIAILHAGGNFNPFTLDGEPWRIITSMFIHHGIWHLLVNMYGLYSIGSVIEPGINSIRFLILYFICGVAGAILSLAFNVFVVSAGASGAIFGLFGYMLGAEVIGSLNDRSKLNSVIINFVIFLVVNFFVSLQFNVDLWAHFGGFIAGAILAILHFKFGMVKGITALLVILVVLPFAILLLPKDQVEYSKIFKEFIHTERRENLWNSTVRSDAALVDSLKTSLTMWDSLYSSLGSMKHARQEIAIDTALLRRYTSLHRSQTAFRLRLIENESYIYLDSVEINRGKFDSVPPLHNQLFFLIDNETVLQPDTTSNDQGPQYEMTKVYFDSAWKEVSDPMRAAYFRIGTRDSALRWQGSVRDYYRDGTIQMKGKYKDNIRDGVFLYYSDRNTYESAGRYSMGLSVGKWEHFHWNGRLKEEVFYGNGGFTRNTWDSLGNPQVVNGFGKSVTWYDNGVISEEGRYENGKREGYFHGYHRDGSPYYEDMYRKNDLVRGVAITKEGKRYVYDELSEYPTPEGGMQAFRKYEIMNKRSETLRYNSGTVKVIFNVGVDSSMWDFTILESTCKECNEEAIRLVKEGPRWIPGVVHGHVKVPGQGYVEIPF